MNILYFHQHFSTPEGSTGIRSYEMAQALIHEGHSVTMVCGSYGGGNTGIESEFRGGRRSDLVNGIRVIEYDLSYSNADGFFKRTLTFARFAAQGVWLALTERYDLLFATSTPLTAGIPGIFARWLRRKKFVFEVRDLWPELPREMGVITNPIVLTLLSVLEWLSYKSAHRLIALSPGMVSGIVKRGNDKRKVAMIPNGCDLELFRPDHLQWLPKGLPSNKLLAVFSGTHGMANGLDSVLDGMSELKRRGRDDIVLLLIGQGALKPALQARVISEGLDNVFFHDPVEKDKLAGLLAAAVVGIQSLANVEAFYYGTSPNKFFDYISAGLPVIINYPGWLAGMIEERNIGFVAKPDCPESFADKMEFATDIGNERRKVMGLGARKFGHAQFHRCNLAKQFTDWLKTTNEDT